MKLKKIIKPFIITIILIYLGLYLFYINGYNDTLVRREKELMEEAVLKYEDDLKNGVDVSKYDYLVDNNKYDNVYTNFILKSSSKVENIIDTSIKFIFRKINNVVND